MYVAEIYIFKMRLTSLTVEKFRYFPQKGKILFKLIFVVN